MIIRDYIAIISKELGLKTLQVKNTLELLASGATVPFIARYRKEATDSLDEVMVSKIGELNNKLMELDKRRASIFDSITEQGKMTPALEEEIEKASTLSELEDIYLPYKPKRKTRATVALEKGLEPLARKIYGQQDLPLREWASSFIKTLQGVATVEEALTGARDIIAEWICEDKQIREKTRRLFMREGVLHSKVLKGKESEGEKYANFFDFSELLRKAPSHRVLALFRGGHEGFLRVSLFPEEEKAMALLKKTLIRNGSESARQVWTAAVDSYKRLLQPQMETEAFAYYKEKADREAIGVFAVNLRQLLMAPPLGQKRVLALDPGFRTGCKTVVLDAQGKLLHNDTLYPHPPRSEYKLSSDKLRRLVSQYQIEAIAIGNGTAGRETENFVRKIPFEREVLAVVVNESGASVYSASAVAREEFPDYDVTVRGAVSIGRRLMDPLAELVKVDPKSIGVGQYQHDVNQNKLKSSLEETVTSCVNQVGVEVNTASKELLSYVSGVGPALAKNIVEYRNQNGPFANRKSLLKVPRFGEKAFEQAAGFLRIHASDNPLDSSAVHPESYHIADEMARRNHCTLKELMESGEIRQSINLQDYITDKVGLPTLKDILQELAKPGRDPRQHFDLFEFDPSIRSINDLVEGMVVPGIVTNITKFGCFVDIGVHQDGLVHVSQMANRYVANPNEVVSLNQKVRVKVLDVDVARRRINLTLRHD